jgi:hypothetical protein
MLTAVLAGSPPTKPFDRYRTLDVARAIAESGRADEMARPTGLTDANSAVFDAANGFAGCIAGVDEVLRRQRLLAGTWCLDPHEGLSPGQAEELTRVTRSYPWIVDDDFVTEHLDDWLR